MNKKTYITTGTTLAIVLGLALTLFSHNGQAGDNDMTTDHLTDMQKYVTLHDGTEPPFQNEYWDNKEPGIYIDVVSGDALF